MIELLIESQYFEVRESFAKLLSTAISVTAKNEESYMFKVMKPTINYSIV